MTARSCQIVKYCILRNIIMGNSIKSLCRKFLEMTRGRNKKKTEVNWPELDTYCGCCTLSTGIFIRSIITLVVTLIFMALNGAMLKHLLEVKAVVNGNNVLIEDEFLAVNRTYTQQELDKLQIVYKFLIAYYVIWLTYKTIYVIILCWSLPDIFKRSNKMIKILLYTSIPNWLVDLFITLLATTLSETSLLVRIPLFLCIISEGYNILAITSEYKRMTGKLKPRHRDIEGVFGTQPLSQFTSTSQGELRYARPHCSTCKCFEQRFLTQLSSTSVQSETPTTNKQIDDFEINYALTGVLNMGNIEARSSTSPRPNTLDLKLNTTDDEKIVVTDDPTIYDVDQLNVGTSPVIDNKKL